MRPAKEKAAFSCLKIRKDKSLIKNHNLQLKKQITLKKIESLT